MMMLRLCHSRSAACSGSFCLMSWICMQLESSCSWSFQSCWWSGELLYKAACAAAVAVRLEDEAAVVVHLNSIWVLQTVQCGNWWVEEIPALDQVLHILMVMQIILNSRRWSMREVVEKKRRIGAWSCWTMLLLLQVLAFLLLRYCKDSLMETRSQGRAGEEAGIPQLMSSIWSVSSGSFASVDVHVTTQGLRGAELAMAETTRVRGRWPLRPATTAHVLRECTNLPRVHLHDQSKHSRTRLLQQLLRSPTLIRCLLWLLLTLNATLLLASSRSCKSSNPPTLYHHMSSLYTALGSLSCLRFSLAPPATTPLPPPLKVNSMTATPPQERRKKLNAWQAFLLLLVFLLLLLLAASQRS